MLNELVQSVFNGWRIWEFFQFDNNLFLYCLLAFLKMSCQDLCASTSDLDDAEKSVLIEAATFKCSLAVKTNRFLSYIIQGVMQTSGRFLNVLYI